MFLGHQTLSYLSQLVLQHLPDGKPSTRDVPIGLHNCPGRCVHGDHPCATDEETEAAEDLAQGSTASQEPN